MLAWPFRRKRRWPGCAGCHDAGRVAGADQGSVLVVGDVADPVQPVLYFPVAADPGGQGGRAGVAVAGDHVDDLDGFLAVLPVTVRRSCATWAAPSNTIQAGASAALRVRRARRPWSVLTDEPAGTAAQGSFFSCPYSVGLVAP